MLQVAVVSIHHPVNKQLHIHMALKNEKQLFFSEAENLVFLQTLPGGCRQEVISGLFVLLFMIGQHCALQPTGGSALTFTYTQIC